MGVCDAEPATPVGYANEESAGDVKLKWYEPIMILLLNGKYKLKQNENGTFTLYCKEATDWCYLETLPPPPEHLDLDEFVQQTGQTILEVYEETHPLPEVYSQLAESIQKIQLPPEGSARSASNCRS